MQIYKRTLKRGSQQGAAVGALVLALVTSGAMPSPAQSITDTTQAHNTSIQPHFGFVPPPGEGQPKASRAGGKRDQLCNTETVNPSLTLLMPPTNQGQTVAPRPTLLVYLPSTTAEKVFWKLEDKDNNYHYHSIDAIPQGAGIVSLKLPDSAPALTLGRDFKFSLAVICGAALDPSDPVVEGWIKRIEPVTVAPVPSETDLALELAASYAQNGVWFDAATMLAELRRANPDDPTVTSAWEELLASVQLDTIQNATLLEQLAPTTQP